MKEVLKAVRVNNRVVIQFPALPENIGFGRAAAAAFVAQAECTLEEIEEVKLVISEAVSNSVIHGYGNRGEGMVTLTLAFLPGSMVEITVADQGRGIEDVQQAMQPAYSSDPERMGLGFSFMTSFADRLEVTSTPGQGTNVLMVKSISASDGQSLQ